jgi:hypothetical protein
MPQVAMKDCPAYAEHEEDLRFQHRTAEDQKFTEHLERDRPLVRTSSTQTEEELARLHEENCSSVKSYQFVKPEEMEYVRMGRTMRDWDFLRQLNRIVPARFTGLSRHGLWGMEVQRPSESGAKWEYACGVQAGIMHEYSSMYFDSHNVPTSEKFRGWRTVLLRLILAGFITEESAHRVFGNATGPESTRYRAQLYSFRNRGRY